MVKLTANFEIKTESYKVAHTILDMMLSRGWDEPAFRDDRVGYIGIVQTPKQCAEHDDKCRSRQGVKTMTICVACGKEIQDGITIQFKDILGIRIFKHFPYECEKDGVEHCPKCGYPQYCGCKTCLPKIPEGIKPHKWDKTGNLISCSNCGFTQHCDFWLTLEEFIFLDQTSR